MTAMTFRRPDPDRCDATCFAAGTLIAVADGAVPVETLRPGDLVATVHGGPLLQPLVWVGSLHVNITRHPKPARIAPVIIRAGALGDGVPFRDLRVSPEHALFLGGRLVPARLLLNGSSIVQDMVCRAVTYHHIELDRHGLVISEGAVSETYVDEGSRHLFDQPKIAVLAADGAALRGNGRYAEAVCAPVLIEGDPALEVLRRRLAVSPRPAGQQPG
ncbi:Hint domain-containing protein [Roseomonas sp. CAU 1739]|uniref:Hint domain-containing protein n=1 Tax=Roseomonas sp. CAU 1739 TaxID=3140364 RepID=UPI00325B497D